MSATLQDPATQPRASSHAPLPSLWTTRAVLVAQASYYVLVGLWQLLDTGSFQSVMGPKTDLWMVRTVGFLAAVIGVSLMLAARKEETALEIEFLAIGTAVGLGIVAVVMVLTRSGSVAYVVDALIEFGVVAWWIRVLAPPGAQVVTFPAPSIRNPS